MKLLKKIGIIALTLLGLALFVSSCKKQPNNTSKNTSIIPIIDLSGTYVNQADITDHFNVTLITNDIHGNRRYSIDNYYRYSNGSHNPYTAYKDTVLESTLLNAPGYDSEWAYNGPTSVYMDDCHLYYTSGHFMIQVHVLVGPDTDHQITFFKQ